MNEWNLKYIAFFIGYFLIISIIIFSWIVYSLKHKNKRLLGFFGQMNKINIFSISLIILNFIFISFILLFKIKLNLINIIIPICLILISFILRKDYIYIFFNLLLEGINIFILYMSNLVAYLRSDSPEIVFYILQIIMNIFGLLFYMFTTLKFIKNIHAKE